MNRFAPPVLAVVVLISIGLLAGCAGESDPAAIGENSAGSVSGGGAGAAGDEPEENAVLGTCRVELRIEIEGMNVEGMAVEGRQIDLLPRGRDDGSAVLGKCDELGRVAGVVPAWQEARVRIAFVGNITVVHPELVIPLTSGGVVTRDVKFQVASARLEFPSSVRFPESGSLRLSFVPEEGLIAPSDVLVSLKDGDLQWPIPGIRESAPGILTLGALPVGSYDIIVRIIDKDGEFREVTLDDGTTTWEPTPSFERTVSVDLLVGETTLVNL